MKRMTKVVAACSAALAVGLLSWAFAPRPVEVETSHASTGPFQTTVDEDGRTRVRDRYGVSAPVAGQLVRIALREGDAVESGAVVAELLPAAPSILDERTLRETQARLAGAEAQVARARARVSAARASLQQARSDSARSEQLASQGFVAATLLEAGRLAVEVADRELDAATQDRLVAEHGVEQAGAALRTMNTPPAQRRPYVLRAPVSGRVLRIALASEGVVGAGTTVLEVGDIRRQEVVAELLTSDAVKVSPGAPVVIERWGGAGTLTGQVRLIEPSGFTKVSALGVEEQRVKVLIDITSPRDLWAGLGDGYRVGVRVVTLSMSSAVQVPVSAVFPVPQKEGSVAPGFAVFRLEGGRAKLTGVTLGARNATHAWVRDGLTPGTEVIVYPPAALADGDRVHARKV